MMKIIETLKFNLIEQRGILLLCSIILIITIIIRVTINSPNNSDVDISQSTIIYTPDNSVVTINEEDAKRLINGIE